MHFLKFYADFDFARTCLIFNFNQSLSVEKVSEIRSDFLANRGQLPPVYVVTPYDSPFSSSHHTRSKPSLLIVHHFQKLARLAVEQCKSSLNHFDCSAKVLVSSRFLEA